MSASESEICELVVVDMESVVPESAVMVLLVLVLDVGRDCGDGFWS